MGEHGHGPSWYKIFVVALSSLMTLFLVMLSQCTFTLIDAASAFNTLLCVVYAAFAFVCLLLGLAVCLVGLEHAKRNHVGRKFYMLMMGYFALVALVFLIAEFI